MLKLKRPWFIAVAALAFVLTIFGLGQSIYQDTEAATFREFNLRQQILAKEVRRGIELYFATLARGLRALAKMPPVQQLVERHCRAAMGIMFEELKEMGVNDLALIDSQGILRYSVTAPQIEGMDFSWRSYFQAAREMRPGARYAVELIQFKGAEVGQKGILIAVPMFGNDGEKDAPFLGVVVCTLKLDTLTQRFTEPVKPSPHGATLLIDANGTVLWPADADLFGQPLLTATGRTPEFRREIARMQDGQEGMGNVLCRRFSPGDPSAPDERPENHLVAYVPVQVGDQTWSVGLFTPQEDVRILIRSAYHKQLLLVGVAGFIILLGASFALISSRRAQKLLEAEVDDKTHELREAHHRLLTVLNSIDALVYVADIDTYEILFGNKVLEQAYGSTAGKVCWNVLQKGQEGPCAFCTNDKILDAKGQPTGVHAWDFQSTRSGRWYAVRDRAIRWVDGRIARLEIALDITERKQAEDALRASEHFLQIVIDGIPEPLMVIDRDYGVVLANRTVREMAGGKDPVAAGMKCYEVSHHRDSPCGGDDHTCTLDEIVATKKSVVVTHMHFDEEGRNILVEVVSAPIFDENGEVVQIIESCHDITARVRAEEEARLQREHLVQMDKMASLGVLVSGVAHEINNPNQFVMSNLSLLGEAWQSAAPILNEYYQENGDFLLAGLPYGEVREQVPEMFTEVLSGCQRIKYVVQELRDFASQHSADLSESVEINAVVRSAVLLLTKMIEKSTYNFSVTYNPGLPTVRGNFRRLEQVLVNLIQNACQALPDPDCSIRVATYWDRAKDVVVVEVFDDGVGISQEVLRRITDPFFTTRRESGGTGLGVSIASSIVNEHGGTLGFMSDPGKGTTASVVLPGEPGTAEEANTEHTGNAAENTG
ncbi:MAG: PAS domain-containing protein [Nitrospiraceae bacterium]|nr:PAS domain-containing protein [Nitrospiraceae bacterium]